MTPAELTDRLRAIERVDPGAPNLATQLRGEPEGRRRRLVLICAKERTGDHLADRMWRQLAADLEAT